MGICGVFRQTCIFTLLIWILGLSSTAEAKRVRLFDYDSTIVEDRADYEGLHETSYRLFRINYRGTAFQSEIKGPKYIDISHEDYERLTERKYDPLTKHPQDSLLLARGEGKLGSLTSFKLQDGRTFIPGHYMIVSPDTYEKYNESTDGKNYYEESFARGFQRHKKGQGTVKGEAFELYYSLINNPETIEEVFVASSRGHSYEEVFEKLKNDRDKRKLIADHVSDADLSALAKRHIMLMRQEYQQFNNDMGVPSIAVLKAEFVMEIAKALINVNPADYVMQVNSTGDRMEPGVELLIAEDRFEYNEAMRVALQELVNRRKFLKVIIYNTGRNKDVQLSERPKAYVLTPFSRERELTVQEEATLRSLGISRFSVNDPAPSRTLKLKRSRPAPSCSRYFGGGK